MNRATLAKFGAVMVMGIVLLSNQGCNTKGLKSDSEGGRGSGSVGTKLAPVSGGGSSGDTKLPTISGESSSGELSGFSRNPSEERLAQGGDSGALTLSEVGPRQRTELRKEEKAAVEAGLQDVFFGYEQWTLSDAGMDALDHGAAYLNNHPAAVLKIEGHCDERGTSAYNLVLGEKRAKAVRNYLVELGVGANRLSVVSYGKERPSCTEHAESCYQQNRRGHLAVKVGK